MVIPALFRYFKGASKRSAFFILSDLIENLFFSTKNTFYFHSLNSALLLKKIVALLIIIISSSTLFAQEEVQFTHHYFITPLYNPAGVGNHPAFNAGADFRVQWLGITGQPISQMLYANMPIKQIHGGLGAIVLNDFSGAHRSTTFNLQYAYAKKLSLGMFYGAAEVGLIQYNLQGNKLRAPDGVYANGIDHNDVKLPEESTNAFSPDLGIGFKLNAKKWNAGLSIKHLYSTPLTFTTNTGQSGTVQYKPSLYTSFAYLVVLNSSIELHPSLLFKSDFKKATLDWGAIATYKSKYIAGLGFRGFTPHSFDALAISLGYQLTDKLFLIYSYDLTLSRLIRVSTGSHELSIHYKMAPPAPPVRGKIIYSPRFL